jgi:hypothetical protein
MLELNEKSGPLFCELVDATLNQREVDAATLTQELIKESGWTLQQVEDNVRDAVVNIVG